MARPPVPRPRRHTCILVAVLLLAGLSGCNTPLLDSHQYPPGVNETGVQNATALADAHKSALQDGYRLHSTATVVAANGTTLTSIESRLRWAPDRANRTITYTNPHIILGTHAEIYENETTTYLKLTMPSGEQTTRRLNESQPSFLIQDPSDEWESVYTLVGGSNTTVTAFDNGTTRIRVHNVLMGTGTGNGTLYVTESGLVTRYTATYERRYVNVPVTFHRTVVISHVGDPGVQRPDWIRNVSD